MNGFTLVWYVENQECTQQISIFTPPFPLVATFRNKTKIFKISVTTNTNCISEVLRTFLNVILEQRVHKT